MTSSVKHLTSCMRACLNQCVVCMRVCVCVLVGGWVVAHVRMRNVGSEYSTAYSFLA